MNSSQTIVVGYDASTSSLDAVRWARAVAGPDDRIHVVSAWDIPISVGHEMVLVVDPDEIEAHTTRLLEELIAAEGDGRMMAETCRGHAGRALVEAAEHADVVVVGHRGNSRMSLLIGSTANFVVHHTERPVVVVRGDHPAPPAHVVVGVDDFDDVDDNPSVRAVRWASRLHGVERLTAVHGWHLPPLAVGMFQEQAWDVAAMDEAALAVARRAIDSAEARPVGVDVTAESARGTGAFALIERSRDVDVDLVVVGRRGRGGFVELLLGSTSAALAAHSHCPVAIVR